MAFYYLDTYLWWQAVCAWMYVFEALVIVLVERFWRMSLMIASCFLPVAAMDWFRQRFIINMPRLFRGYGDHEKPEIFFDSPQLAKHRGYPCEEHYVKTEDGFLLCLHRIPHANNNNQDENIKVCPKITNKHGESIRPVVFIMHGFLQSSEAFLSGAKSIPFMLADAGFDVWLGNARGNKYSCKHAKYTPQEEKYWDFCLDEAATIDIPTNIKYVIQRTGAPSLSYIGFSQGTAVAFAALSMNDQLNKLINKFVALAPTTLLKGFANPLVNALTRSSPEVIYLILGKKDLLPSTLFWKRSLSSKAYIQAIDSSCGFLFGWDMKNVDPKDKLMHYAHIYSYSSVKSVVHWFQLFKTRRFQMYDNFRWKAHDAHNYVQPRFALEQISTPIVVFHGGRDELPDRIAVSESLPKSTQIYEVPAYEHMDFMYSSSAPVHVYPKIIDILCHTVQNLNNSSNNNDNISAYNNNGLRRRHQVPEHPLSSPLSQLQKQQQQQLQQITPSLSDESMLSSVSPRLISKSVLADHITLHQPAQDQQIDRTKLLESDNEKENNHNKPNSNYENENDDDDDDDTYESVSQESDTPASDMKHQSAAAATTTTTTTTTLIQT